MGLYLPIELRPMKIGSSVAGDSMNNCKLRWIEHSLFCLFELPEETDAQISAQPVHENCHSLGGNQKPQTRTFDGQ